MGPITPDDLRFNRFGLSQQESRVLALAMTGRIDKQIASEIGISLGTVRVYWKRIRMKVGGTRSEVIAELARTALKLDYDGTRKKADSLEKELEESMVRERALRVYESVFDTVPTPLAIFDGLDGDFVRVNAAFAELQGYPAEELEGTPVKSLMEPKEATRLATQLRKAKQGDKPYEGNLKLLKKDGSILASKVSISGDDETNWILTVQG